MARSKSVQTPPETSSSRKPSDLRLNAFSSKLVSFQRELLNSFWRHYQEHGKWPLTRIVHSKFGTQEVRESLRSIGGDIVREQENPPNDTYELSLLGILMTSQGEDFRRLLLRYLEFLRQQFRSHPEKGEFNDKEIQQELSLLDSETAILGRLLRLSHSLGLASWSDKSWTIRVPKEVDFLPRVGSLDTMLDEWLFRHFQERPVLAEEAHRNWKLSTASSSPAFHLSSLLQPMATTIDALKRRYQVFVSSTYEDLKDERQQVIQALLETKCIPLGMELFPAASIEQWKLIQRVIDECDYYIVVIAGRYGTLNEAQFGYTEMELDYALSIGKPIIGFYHKSPETLPLSKSEETDAGRERLKKFSEKVKKKLCRPWSSAAELGSAVKSAIIHELEFNPRPGWIRADSITSSEQVEKLKQRVADLEEQIKKKNSRATHHANAEPDVRLTFEVVVDLGRKKAPDFLDIEVRFSSDELFVTCVEFFKSSEGWSNELQSAFPKLVQTKIAAAIAAQIPAAEFLDASIAKEELEHVLHTFVAQKLMKVSSNGWSGRNGAYLEVTDKGLHRFSEAKVKQRQAPESP